MTNLFTTAYKQVQQVLLMRQQISGLSLPSKMHIIVTKLIYMTVF